MKKTLMLILNLGLLAALGWMIGYFVIFDEENDTAAPIREAATTTTTVPSKDFVSDGPNAEKLRAEVEDLDLTVYLDDDNYDDWEIGMVDEIQGELRSMSMVTGAFTDVFYESDDCADEMPDEYLSMLYDPGDLVLWNTEGDDNRFCMNEIRLVKER